MHRPFLAAFALLLCLVAAPAPVAAQAADAFVVSGIGVDVRAGNAAAAREQALVEGEQQAFERLLARLVPAGQQGRLPKPSPADLDALVSDVGIEQEKASTVRYIATLSVRFKPEAVRGYLQTRGVPYAEARRNPVVVLPVYAEGGSALLWNEPNPWRQVWARRRNEGLVSFVVPLGELQDVTAVSAEQAISGDAQALSAIGRRYGTADVLVAEAAARQAPGAALTIRLRASGPGVPVPDPASFSIPAREGETFEALVARAVDEVVQAIGESYKNQNLLQFDRPASLAAVVPLAGLDDWLMVRGRLDRVPQVRSYRVVSLNRTGAALMLDFVGDQQQLQGALMRGGIDLAWVDGQWQMQPAPAAEAR